MDTSTCNKKNAIEISLKFVYFVVFSMIIASSVIYYVDGYLGGDLEGIKYPVNNFQLLIFTLIYILGLIVSGHFSRVMVEFNLTKYKLYSNKRLVYLFAIIFSVLTALILVFGSVGLINRGITTNRYAELFFAAFDPYTLMALMIYYVFLNNKNMRILYLLLFIYLILIFRSGFTGYLILIFPVLTLILMGKISTGKTKILLFLSILTFPFIRFAKWIIVVGIDILDTVNFDNELYMVVIKGTVERFSAVSNMIYISDNYLYLMGLLDTEYLPFFQGYIGSFFHKILFSEPVALNTLFLHQTIQETNSDSNSTFPLISFFSLDFTFGILSLFYALFLVFTASRLLGFIYGDSVLGKLISRYILFFLTFFYVFNGWFWAVNGIIQALLVFASILFVFGKIAKS